MTWGRRSRRFVASCTRPTEWCKTPQRETEKSQHEAYEYRRQLEEIRSTKTFRMVAPFRRVYGRIRRVGSAQPAPPGPT